jgi:hypothetical protein
MNIKQKMYALILAITGVIAAGSFAAPVMAAQCGGAQTAIIQCQQTSQGPNAQNSGVWGVLLIALNILTAGVGIAAVGGIVYGSILYTSAGDSTEQTKKAIEIIRNVVIGLVAYGMMFIGLNFLIPGGVFTT